MATIPSAVSPPALVFTPQGRDAEIAGKLLGEIGVGAVVVTDLVDFMRALGNETGFAVLTEESLRSVDLRALASWVDGQPSWSDFPFIILTRRGGGPDRNPVAARLSQVLGNVTFLERPFNAVTFLSVARTALKGRRRQFEARARIEDLGEGEERLRTALLAGRLGTWELDMTSEGPVLSGSETFKAIFGRFAHESLTYEEALASIHPDDREPIKAMLDRTIETGHDYLVEHRTIWPDGTLHWSEIRARAVKSNAGETIRLVGVSSDITDRKLYEDRLLHLNESLEERVDQRTSELQQAHRTLIEEVAQRERAEEQLRHSQKLEAIGQLTGGVAHDFNNLLMAVMGNLDLLRKHCADDPKAARLIEGALQGAKRGAALTQRLLAFARRQDLRVQPVDMVTLVGGMTDLLERSTGPNIRLNIETASSLPMALVDGNQVELALLNLVVNARDAMPDGGTLTITLDTATAQAKNDLSPGAYLRLSVIDTGVGMSEETLKKAVDPFFSTKEVGKGTGLGLSMIHGLAVQLKGALRLTSAVGRGTRAELWLPATEMQVPLADPVPDETPRMDNTKATILFVDDDALIAMSTVDMLEDLGHEVIEASSGAAALDILKSRTGIDLLITDYSMPGMTGAQLARAAVEMKPDLPVLVATGYADLPEGGGLDLPRLGKPYTQDQLASEIAKLLKSTV